MSVIAVCALKGGVGKTTVAVNLSGELVRLGHSVLLVNADPQGSAMDWFALAGDDTEGWPAIVSITKPVLHKPNQVPQLAGSYDYIVIDGPPNLGSVTKSALACADIALLPLRPSALDLQATKATLELVEAALVVNEDLDARLLISQRMPGTVVGREARKVLRTPPFSEFPTLRTEITHRIALTESAAAGLPIQQYDPGSKSAKEFKKLAEEVLYEEER